MDFRKGSGRFGTFLRDGRFAQGIVFADIVERLFQVLDETHRRERFPAARAVLHGGVLSRLPVQLDADGGRALNQVEKFPEWQRDQPHDH